MKTNYKAGKYILIREQTFELIQGTGDTWRLSDNLYEVHLDLTAAQAKVMFQLYNKLGFKEIIFVPE